MHVKLKTIMAGPDGCADVDQIISVSDAEGARLIAAGSAVEVQHPRRETAMIDPRAEEERQREEAHRRAEEEAARKSQSSVGAALDQLDPDDDDHWTSKGKPAMDAVKELTGSTTITRSEIDAMFPDFARPVVEVVSGAAAAAATASTGPRSSAP